MLGTCCTPSALPPAAAPLPPPPEITAAPVLVPTPPVPTRKRAVYLVTVDGTRWQDVIGCDNETGSAHCCTANTPNLCRLAGHGGVTVGKESVFQASGPNCVSLPGYLEITRGRESSGDCRDNGCKPAAESLTPNIVDGFAAAAAFSGWPPIALTVPAGTPGNFGDKSEYRLDVHTFRLALRWLQQCSDDALCSGSATRFFWLSLGDTDEWAHAGSRAGYLKALRDADAYVDRLVREHASLFPDVDASFVVTADHGRSDWDWRSHGDPTSCRLWLFSFGAAQPPPSALHMRTLSDVAPLVRSLR
jgi:hypothetical protein